MSKKIDAIIDSPVLDRRTVLRDTSLLAAAAILGQSVPATAQGQQAATVPAPPFPGFTAHDVETSGGVTIRAVKGGSGPPLLLLHDAPLTHYTWRDVAPQLAEDFTVIAADLRGYGDWFSYLQPAPIPENTLLAQQQAPPTRPLSQAQLEYRRRNGTPEGVHAMCEDYRAGASIDLAHDGADLDRRIECPLHVLWAQDGAMDRLYDVLAIWRERGTDVTGKGMPGGHNMQEGAPAEVLAELRAVLRA